MISLRISTTLVQQNENEITLRQFPPLGATKTILVKYAGYALGG